MKRTSGVWFVIAAVIFLTGYCGLFQNRRFIVNAFTDTYTNLDEVLAGGSVKDIPKGYYYLYMDAAFECFAVKSENGKDIEAGYIIWLKDGSVAPIVVASSNMDNFNRLVDGTWDYLDGKTSSLSTYPMQGIAKTAKLDSEMSKFYYETLDDIGVSADNFVIRDVVFDFERGSGLKNSVRANIIMVIAGIAVFIIILVVIRISGYKASKPFAVNKLNRYAVSGKVAAARISEANIKKCYNVLMLSTVISLAVAALAVIVPVSMYVYRTVADNSFPIENVTSAAVIATPIFVCGLIFGVFTLFKLKYMIDGLRQFNDSEFSMLEREMASATTKRFPQNLFFTENHLVMLAPFSFGKDVIDSHNAILFTKYKDIVWMYPANRSINYYRTLVGYSQSFSTDNGIAICGPRFGRSIIISLSVYKNKNGIVSYIYKTLEERCPGALMGYTQENKVKAAQIISNM